MAFAKENDVKVIQLDYEEQVLQFFDKRGIDFLLFDTKLLSTLVKKLKIDPSHIHRTKISPFENRGYIIFPRIKKSSAELRDLFDKGVGLMSPKKINRFLYDEC